MDQLNFLLNSNNKQTEVSQKKKWGHMDACVFAAPLMYRSVVKRKMPVGCAQKKKEEKLKCIKSSLEERICLEVQHHNCAVQTMHRILH